MGEHTKIQLRCTVFLKKSPKAQAIGTRTHNSMFCSPTITNPMANISSSNTTLNSAANLLCVFVCVVLVLPTVHNSGVSSPVHEATPTFALPTLPPALFHTCHRCPSPTSPPPSPLLDITLLSFPHQTARNGHSGSCYMPAAASVYCFGHLGIGSNTIRDPSLQINVPFNLQQQ